MKHANPLYDALYQAFLTLETKEECHALLEDLCTMKEIEAMAHRLEAARLLVEGKTYEQIIQATDISSATLSRVSRCIQYGSGGYRLVLKRMNEKK